MFIHVGTQTMCELGVGKGSPVHLLLNLNQI